MYWQVIRVYSVHTIMLQHSIFGYPCILQNPVELGNCHLHLVNLTFVILMFKQIVLDAKMNSFEA